MRSDLSTGFTGAEEATGLLDDARSALTRLIHGEFCKLDGDALLDIGRGLEHLSRLLWAAQVHLTDEIGQQHLATTLGATSTAALLRQAFRLTPGEACTRVRAATALLPQDLPTGGEAPSRHPALAAALDTGDITGAAVDAALRMFRRLPDTVPTDVRAAAEDHLVDHARTQDPVVYRRIVDHLETVLHPDGPAPDDPTVHDKMELRIGPRNRTTGLTPIRGWLDDLAIATLRAVTDPLAAPRPTTSHTTDPAADGDSHPGDGTPIDRANNDLRVPDTRPAATRLAHALHEALTHVLRHSDGLLPDTHGHRPHITLTLNWHDLRTTSTRLGHPDLTPGQTRQLLCDADILPAVLDGPTQILDIGRSRRTFPTAIRRAITLRDRGCIWPGCNRPPSWCDTHHIAWWHRDLGPTSHTNGTLLCALHHTRIHQPGPDGTPAWTIHTHPDGTPELIPPPWIDPTRTPRRNTLHHTPPVFTGADAPDDLAPSVSTNGGAS